MPSVPPKYARANPPGIRHAFAVRVARRICIHCKRGTPTRFDGSKHHHDEKRACAADVVWMTLAEVDEEDDLWS